MIKNFQKGIDNSFGLCYNKYSPKDNTKQKGDTNMKKFDNRIIRPEQMNEKDMKVMAEALESFYQKYYCKEHNPADNPNLVQIDGKWYDKRYMKK